MIRFIKEVFKFFLFFIISILLFQYFLSKHYTYKSQKPFSGDSLYNPYKNLGMSWQKANFHAHSRAWMGLTNGHFTPDSVYGKYVELGYSVPIVSNYHLLSDLPNKNASNYIPVYEHGYNRRKTHQLAIGATKVTFYDLPLYQSLDNKQFVLD